MKILFAENELDLGISIYRDLLQEKYIVDWVQDGVSAWNYLDSQYNQYILSILNWELPGLTGLELCKRLRNQQSSLLVLILVKPDRWEDGVLSLDAGADDYLMKPFRREELLARLRALRRRFPQFQSLQLRFGNLTLDCDSQTLFWQSVKCGQRSVQLSKKEFQLLEYFMKHPYKAASHGQILNYLYEVKAERTSNVVAAQIRRLRRKLLDLGCENVIQTLPGGNYRLNPDYAD
ncbi:response regulator with CheY-like receiver domain and winged-helix DNA-binding domain [Leptolyngbyaceae cyanobacterium JSC-12]|nr:response regulator with CheY-like receiver domain and winged-helix DNA-binding domain [Leptolyngbyaceae cyanobacterium JSC-12]